MRLNLSLSHKGLILIAVPLIFELFSFAWLYTALQGAEKEIRRETYAKNVLGHMNMLTQLVIGASTSLYFYRSTVDRAFLARYKKSIGQLHEEFEAVRELYKDKPRETESLQSLEQTVDRAVVCMEESRRAVEVGDDVRLAVYVVDLKNILRHLTDQVEKVSADYRKIAQSAPKLEEHRRELLKQLVLLAIVASIVMAAGLATYFNRDTTGRLGVLMANTKRFARGETLPGALEGSDEIAELDEVFHQMADAITEAAQRKQEFVAMITHDMRSPLTAVLNSLGMLAAGAHGEELTGRTREVVERSELSLERIIKLINDLLDAEKLEAGQMDMHFETVPVSYVLDNAVQAIRGLADQKRISLVVPRLDTKIFADGDRLIQVLINLLSNALKFSPEEGKLTVAIREEGDWLEMRLTDEGPGIPQDESERIFERFQQVRSSSARVKGGTGLGLAICKDIIGQHHGTIGVESEEGKGSTFWFRIPLTEEAMSKVGRA